MSRGSLLALGALALLLVVSGLFVHNERTRANNAEIQAIEHKGRADAAVESALRADQAAVLSQSKAEEQDRIVANLRSKLADAQRTHVQPTSPVEPSDHPLGGSGIPASVDPVDVDVLKDELIEAQNKQITDLKASVVALTNARDGWKKAHDERLAECIQKDARIASLKGLSEGQLWKGRIQGFAVGVASGYVTGRLH